MNGKENMDFKFIQNKEPVENRNSLKFIQEYYLKLILKFHLI